MHFIIISHVSLSLALLFVKTFSQKLNNYLRRAGEKLGPFLGMSNPDLRRMTSTYITV